MKRARVLVLLGVVPVMAACVTGLLMGQWLAIGVGSNGQYSFTEQRLVILVDGLPILVDGRHHDAYVMNTSDWSVRLGPFLVWPRDQLIGVSFSNGAKLEGTWTDTWLSNEVELHIVDRSGTPLVLKVRAP